MARARLYVHVGLQKTGTSYLQAVMLGNRDLLAAQGLDLVPPTKRESFDLMVVVRDRYRDRRTEESDQQTLDRFTRQLDRAPGDRALLSQESLAAARPAQVRRLLAACGDREVHVVATVRDLARQLPSSWQQELKAGATIGYPAYLRRLQRLQEQGSGAHPWIHLDPPQVLARWSAELSPDRVHVVTVPPSGSGPTALLERFCRVLGVDPAGLEPGTSPANTGLGRAQAELLRRVNQELPDRVHRREVYGDVGKRYFAAGVLAGQDGDRILVPAGLREWCEQVTVEQVGALRAAGYQVEGSLTDLECAEESFAPAPQRPGESAVAAASVQALATMLEDLAAQRTGRTSGSGDPATARPGVRGRLLGRFRRVVSGSGADG